MTVLLKGRNALLSTKIWKYLFSKTVPGGQKFRKYKFSDNLVHKLLEICENRYCSAFPKAIENSFKRAYGEVEDNIIIYIERLKT